MSVQLSSAIPRGCGASSRDTDDPLFAFLVGTIHSAKAPLAASTAMAMLITLAAYEVTGAFVFLAQVLAQVVIGLARLHRLAVYRRQEPGGRTLSFLVHSDRAFAFWCAAYAVTLGMTCYGLTARSDSPDDFALALAACTGFTLAFVTRSAGRPWTLRLQVVGIAAPQVVALLTLPVPHASVYAALVVGLVIAALVMGRDGHGKLVAMFRADQANRRMAQCDMLTGLMNRSAITEAFALASADARRREGGGLAVFLIDLDRFKDINDSRGHAAGDAVLIETARRLRDTVPRGAVARMGGDEFMLVAQIKDPALDAAGALGRSLLEALSRPAQIEGVAIPLGGSVGAAVAPYHGQELAELMKHADGALYEAKREGRGRFRLFDATLQSRLLETRLMEMELEEAIREDQFEVWYQPIQNIGKGAVSGYEALVRWRHPTRGLVFPDQFVRIAEKSGAIFRLGQIVLERACADAVRWDPRVSIAVNLSPQQFRKPEMLVEGVKGALARTGLAPSRLYLEITESLLMDDTPQTRKAINDLAEHGVKFSLDDFGAGYSSLAYIQSYPFSKIKIDRKFVENIHNDRVSSAIVASVCVLAERIEVAVVAEGVETAVQQHALVELGVDLGQGYLYGRPARLASSLTAARRVVSR